MAEPHDDAADVTSADEPWEPWIFDLEAYLENEPDSQALVRALHYCSMDTKHRAYHREWQRLGCPDVEGYYRYGGAVKREARIRPEDFTNPDGAPLPLLSTT